MVEGGAGMWGRVELLSRETDHSGVAKHRFKEVEL